MNRDALADLLSETIDATYKGVPLGATVRLDEVGNQSWNVARGDLALPVTTLRRNAIDHNLDTMAQYCVRHGALFAPHGKTTMSPQLFERQLAAGAWAMTAATPSQVAIMRKYGVTRIIMANELSDAHSVRWIAGELTANPDFDFYCLVDDPETVSYIDDIIAATGADLSLNVLLEMGIDGGRGGIRTEKDAIAVADAVSAARHLTLRGVETYEGLVTSGGSATDLAAIDVLFDRVRRLVDLLEERDLFGAGDVIVTAGGSSYFDRVVAKLAAWPNAKQPVRLVLRSGCYLSHDLGKYHSLSPLDGRRAEHETLHLENALEAWGSVLSCPEPDLVIVGSGKRDVPYDAGLPTALRVHHRDGSVTELGSTTEVFKVMDQHAFLRVNVESAIRPGDIVVFGLSHPCTAFDKSRFIPVIDDDYTVVDAIRTFF
ncbi:alanine racemase [Antrihabitans sp. YC2-6]|uniref:alanine racemase n=1 Tax=Antrihabitans sp. YC2-6 TaxID=2799498 RepID=UPI0018F35417|nr:alanine racemase [Antrihabitans sp. YC2-6]MBJ8344320.1 alanine racemase [Antrihabitans sp. YC2-6]